jgi:hypothetical protein
VSHKISGQPIVAFDPIDSGNIDELETFFYNGLELKVLLGNEKMRPGSQFELTAFESFLFKNKKDFKADFDYSLNSLGLRSEEFLKGSNLLFAGCSFTFGEGLPYKSNWSGILFDEISMKNAQVGQYHNLGYCGGSVDYIIKNIVNYIEIFGAPRYVFALFPESSRKTVLSNKKEITVIPYKEEDKALVWGKRENSFYQMYKQVSLLLDRLNRHDTKLIWSTWDDFDRKMFLKTTKLDGYVPINDFKVLQKATGKTSKNSKYYEKARDEAHPGICYNSGVAQIFLEEYNAWEN